MATYKGKGKGRATSPTVISHRETLKGILRQWEGFGKKGRKGEMGPPPAGLVEALRAARVSDT